MGKPRDKSPVGVEDGWVTVGAMMGAHGVKGDLRVKSFTDDPKALFTYADLRVGDDKSPIRLTLKGEVKDSFIAWSKSVVGREAAAKLKGSTLYVERSALGDVDDEDDFYLVDLIGLEALNADDGSALGHVRSVENFGAEDLLELVLREPVKGFGRHVFVPFRKALVPVVDIEGGRVTIAFKDWWALQSGGDAVEEGEAAEGYRGDD